MSVLEDIRGSWHIVNPEMDHLGESRTYLQAYTTQKWPNTTDFHPIPCELTGLDCLKYAVPEGSYYGAAFILAAQSGRGKAKPKQSNLSLIGIYYNGHRGLVIPLLSHLHYVLYSPLKIPGGVEVEIRFKPYRTKCDLSICQGGFLREIHFND